ncbi:hypothetical protein P154DRAFT_562339 [Amniculicola lignicola CBS 123094]|uniref:Nuclear fusion protein KAR5 n=1 Tax=Amniculicola lignicola CBS 123094 TaxID=1392246 RepID=A0A6A5WM03_9PLEO|nr:hypothetical protein P154DRAFT_562339 [Amniculicola lignicola CBS 123094]
MHVTSQIIAGLTVFTLSLPPGGLAQGKTNSPKANEANSDLASMLHLDSTPIKQQEILSEALSIIHRMESASSCNKLAALNLINDCKALDQSSTNPEAVLDEVKSEYAARLAVCELLAVDASTSPPDCNALIPSQQACVRSRFSSWFSSKDARKEVPPDEYCYPDTTPAQFKRCLRALQSRPQSWTSYSNARQNAVVMCHVTRDAVERAQDLSVYKSLTEVVHLLRNSMQESIKETRDWHAEQSRYAEKVRESQDLAFQDIQAQRAATVSSVNELKNDLFESFTEMMKLSATMASQVLEQTIQQHKLSLDQYRDEMQQYFNSLTEKTQQQAALLRAEMQSTHEHSLTSIQLHHGTVVKSYDILSNSMESLQAHLQDTSNGLGQLHRGIKVAGNAVQGLGAATENLTTIIDTRTNTYLRGVSNLGMDLKLLLSSMICLFGLWKANGKFAGYVTAVCGFLSMLYFLAIQDGVVDAMASFKNSLAWPSPPKLEWSSVPALQSVPAVAMLLGIVGLVGMCQLALSFWSYADALYSYQDDFGKEGVLPRIEVPGIRQERRPFNLFSLLRRYS